MAASVATNTPVRVPWGLRRVEERFVAGNRIRLLQNGQNAFPAMLDAIRSAEKQVLLEMYWFDSNQIGQRFTQALIEALQRGVEVAVLYDSVGSIAARAEMFESIVAAGGSVIEFNPVAFWKRRFRLARLTRRDHRKILVVDGAIGFTGGINIADQWLPEEDDGGGWRDDMVLVEGPAVRGLVDCFAGSWRRVGGRALKHWVTPSSPPEVALALADGGSGQRVRVLTDSHYRGRSGIARAYLARIYAAERRIWIANSYFVPDRNVIRALTRAARRGVDVRILVPSEGDVPIADWASRAVWTRLMRRGVRIFEWTQSILHSKTAVIDGRWSTIGTFNLDHLSLRWNLEVNVTVLDEGFGRTMEAAFTRDFERSLEVDPQVFRYRPLGQRLLEALAYRARKFL